MKFYRFEEAVDVTELKIATSVGVTIEADDETKIGNDR